VSTPPGAATLPWEPVEALGVFMGLLAEVETATPQSTDFYDSLCDATCRLAHLRRAVIFLWDDARREVRAVGSHDVPLEVFETTPVSTVNVPLARAALAGDCVVEAHERFEAQIPAEIVAALRPRNLVCTPMSASGLWFGVLIAEREQDGPLSDTERHTLWTLGKVAGLAASARIATHTQDRARSLGERIALARELHESVIQRLFAVSLALGSGEALTEEDRERCLLEVQQAAQEVRAAMQRPLEPVRAAGGRRLATELERLSAEHPDLGLRPQWESGVELPTRYEGVAQNVLAEAVRNARKHARPSGIDIAVARRGDALVLQVANDGVDVARRGAGMGLKLAALEALQHGALVEFGPEAGGRWCVRLIMPLELD
jgi:signal transduction histidine kinase